MADISKALMFTLQNEGGASYSDHPMDRGGPTKFGITLKTLTSWRHYPCTADDVKHLTEEEACRIYKIHYWDPLKLDGIIDQGIATAIFDCAVNRGVGVARQYAMDICDHLAHLTINECKPKEFIELFSNRMREGYLHIIESHPSQIVFKNGWMNRADRILTLI